MTEVVARAILEKPPAPGRPAPAPGTPEESAQSLRVKLSEEGPRSAVESLKRKKVDQGQIDRLNFENIGTERKQDGTKKLSTKEGGRLKEAQKWEKLAKTYAEKGYEGLQSEGLLADARQVVIEVINAWPDGKIILDSLSPGDKEAAIDKILKDPKLVDKIGIEFSRAVGPDKALKDGVSEFRKIFEETKSKEDQKKTERTKNIADQSDTDARLAEFAPGAGKDTRIKSIEGRMGALNSEKAGKVLELEDARGLRATYQQAKRKALINDPSADVSKMDALIGGQNTDILRIQGEIDAVDKEIQEKVTLEEEKKNLEKKSKDLTEKKIELDTELDNLRRERLAAQADFEDAKAKRGFEEQEFVDGLRDAFSNGVADHFIEVVGKAEEVEKQLIEEEKAKATDPDERAILDELLPGGRWDKPSFKKGRRSHCINKVQVKQDYGTLIVEGPKGILEDILKSKIKHAPGSQEYNNEVARINKKLLDKDFVEKMQPKVVERIMNRQIQIGRITEDDVRILRESDWGKGVVETAIKNKQEFRNEVEKLYGQGALESPIFWDRLRRLSNGSFLKLLLLFFGGIATVGLLPGGFAIKTAMGN